MHYSHAEWHRFAAVNLDRQAKIPGYDKIVQALTNDDSKRIDFFKACLLKLGLEVNQESSTVPSLSRLHLSSASPSDTPKLIDGLKDIISVEDGKDYIKGENDTFMLEKLSTWSPAGMADALPDSSRQDANDDESGENRFPDYDKIIKQVVVHEEVPTSKETPYFNHNAFYANLAHYNADTAPSDGNLGKHILYGEVVTSTNTMLEK